MRRFGYPQSFSTGVIGSAHARAMLPPSTVLAVYRHHHPAGHRKTVHRRRGAGLLAILMHMITIGIIGVARPGLSPCGPQGVMARPSVRCATSWSPLLLFRS